jgi:2-methylisocitrate lyase-like PEP mutase family enzyme
MQTPSAELQPVVMIDEHPIGSAQGVVAQKPLRDVLQCVDRVRAAWAICATPMFVPCARSDASSKG